MKPTLDQFCSFQAVISASNLIKRSVLLPYTCIYTYVGIKADFTSNMANSTLQWITHHSVTCCWQGASISSVNQTVKESNIPQQRCHWETQNSIDAQYTSAWIWCVCWCYLSDSVYSYDMSLFYTSRWLHLILNMKLSRIPFGMCILLLVILCYKTSSHFYHHSQYHVSQKEVVFSLLTEPVPLAQTHYPEDQG